MKKIIFLNAGHSINDPGAVANNTSESMEARKIRNELSRLLIEGGFDVISVPDDIDLKGSIEFINKRSKELDDGLAISIHLNAGGGSGAECFYHPASDVSKDMAEKMINVYCRDTGYQNRGAKPDTEANVGKLAWIRETNPWALLIEACFVDSASDLDYLHKHLDKVAKALYEAILAIYNGSDIEEKPKTEENNDKKTLIDDIVKTYKRLGDLLHQYFKKYATT